MGRRAGQAGPVPTASLGSQRAAGFGDLLPVGSSMSLVTILPRK